MISWRVLLLGSVTSPAREAPKNFPYLLNKKSILLLAPSSIPVDALFQCTCPLLVANFQVDLSWLVTDTLCYTAVCFMNNFIGDLTDESTL